MEKYNLFQSCKSCLKMTGIGALLYFYYTFFHNNSLLIFKIKTVHRVSFLKRKREKALSCEY